MGESGDASHDAPDANSQRRRPQSEAADSVTEGASDSMANSDDGNSWPAITGPAITGPFSTVPTEDPKFGSPRDMSEPANWPQIDGFVIKEWLGEGGFGFVFRAHSLELGGDVAIKLLKVEFSSNSRILSRFDQEVQAAAKNRNAYILQVLSKGTCEAPPFEHCRYLVSEYLSGGDFHAWINEEREPNPQFTRDAVEKLIKICRGLESVHDSGIVHRDIKPENILLDDDGNPKLADFGLASFLIPLEPQQGRGADRPTRLGEILGTIAYSAPEQIRDARSAVPASDQYSLGVILYQVLCGCRPWQEFDPGGEQKQILSNLDSLPQSPRQRNRSSNGYLSDICMRCLEPNHKQRYADVKELRADLTRWKNGEPLSGSSRLRHIWHHRIVRPYRQSMVPGIVTGILLLAIVVLGAFVAQRYAMVWPSISRYRAVEGLDSKPVGIGQLSFNEAGQLAYYYEVQRRGWFGKIESVRLVNRRGDTFVRAPFHLHPLKMFQHDPEKLVLSELVPFDLYGQEPTAWRYEYSESGELLRVIALAAGEIELTRLQFSQPGVADFQEVSQVASLQDVAGPLKMNRPQARVGTKWGTDIRQVQNQAIDEHASARFFFNQFGESTQDESGAFGWELRRDDRGRIVRKTCLDGEAMPAITANGYCMVDIDYSQDGRQATYTFRDRYERETTHAGLKASSVQLEYDESGRVTRISFFSFGLPVQNSYGGPTIAFDWKSDNDVVIAHLRGDTLVARDDGTHRIHGTFGAKGRLQEVAYFDRHLKPWSPGELAAHRLRLKHNSVNQIESIATLDEHDQPRRNRLGASLLKLRWNEHNQPLGLSLFHRDEAVTGIFGAHSTQFGYDREQRQRSWACFDVDGNATRCLRGFHCYRVDYEDAGRRKVISYWGPDEEPVLRGTPLNETDVRIHKAVYTYNEFGEETSFSIFGLDEKRLTDPTIGCHRVERSFVDHNETDVIFFDEQDRRTHDSNHVGRYRSVWKAGQKVGLSVFDASDQEFLHPRTGYHRWAADFDEEGREVELSFFGLRDERVRGPNGYHCLRSEYDSFGDLTAESCFDESDPPQPTRSHQGYHRIEYKYDRFHQLAETSYFDTDPTRRLAIDGLWRISFESSPDGIRLAERCFDIDDRATSCEEGWHGWARTLGTDGTPDHKVFFDPDGNELLRVARVTQSDQDVLRVGDLVVGGPHAQKASPSQPSAESLSEDRQIADLINRLLNLDSTFGPQSGTLAENLWPLLQRSEPIQLSVIRDEQVVLIEIESSVLLSDSFGFERTFIRPSLLGQLPSSRP